MGPGYEAAKAKHDAARAAWKAAMVAADEADKACAAAYTLVRVTEAAMHAASVVPEVIVGDEVARG